MNDQLVSKLIKNWIDYEKLKELAVHHLDFQEISFKNLIAGKKTPYDEKLATIKSYIANHSVEDLIEALGKAEKENVVEVGSADFLRKELGLSKQPAASEVKVKPWSADDDYKLSTEEEASAVGGASVDAFDAAESDDELGCFGSSSGDCYNYDQKKVAQVNVFNNVGGQFPGLSGHVDKLDSYFQKDIYNRKYGSLSSENLDGFLKHLRENDFSKVNMLFSIFVCHGSSNGILLAEDGRHKDFTVDNVIESACRNKTLNGKPKVFMFMACKGPKYDHVSEEALLEEPTSTFRDVLAVFTSWEGFKTLITPEGGRMNEVACLAHLLNKYHHSRKEKSLNKLFQKWKYYLSKNTYKTKFGAPHMQTPWVIDSTIGDVFLK